MKSPEISWYIIETTEINSIEKEYYIGSYNPNSTEVQIDLQVWNNKFGQEEAKTIENAFLNLTFTTIEDCKLLEYCKVKIDNSGYQDLTILNSVGKVSLDRLLSGETNLGDATAYNNYATISIKFSLSNNMKNGLKNLILDLQYDN